MKAFYWVLLIILGLFALVRVGQTDWDATFNSEYRVLSRHSDAVTPIFVNRLKTTMEKENIILLKDLISFPWDYVCAWGGYTPLRQDMKEAAPKPYRKDFPELEYFPTVRENATNLVFVSKNRVVAVIEYSLPTRQTVKCSTYPKAAFTLRKSAHAIAPYITLSKKGAYLPPNADAFNKINTCSGQYCTLVFFEMG